ncbi:putative N-acetyltransferase, GNAT family [Diaporthe sp. PMI_573]|nr:putative N-acetyltransferase, GNAT family [Diaporthaceae sp. PMI_573]
MSNESLQFRIATSDDAARIQNLIQTSFRTEDTRARWTGSTELASQFHISVDEVLASFNKPECAVLVATDPTDGSIVASVECVRRRTTAAADNNNNNDDDDDDLARLSMLAVDNSRQRAGLGRAVLARAEDYCRREWGVTRLGLNALSTREELISWYVRCGFERTGETSAFPRDRFPGLKLPEDLCFVELEKDLLATGGK